MNSTPSPWADAPPWAIRDLLDVNTLKTMGVTPHYFGLGFIQIKLNDTWRLHVWVTDWPTIPGAETEIHDHRYDFQAHVLAGALHHEIYITEAPHPTLQAGDFEISRTNCQPGSDPGSTEEGYARALPIGVFTAVAGTRYQLNQTALHVAWPIGTTVTLMERGPTTKDMATVLRIPGEQATCPFSLTRSESECWAKVEACFSDIHLPTKHA